MNPNWKALDGAVTGSPSEFITAVIEGSETVAGSTQNKSGWSLFIHCSFIKCVS